MAICDALVLSHPFGFFSDALVFSDADLERLYEQWEEEEEPLPIDELPEWDPRRPQPQVSIPYNSFRHKSHVEKGCYMY